MTLVKAQSLGTKVKGMPNSDTMLSRHKTKIVLAILTYMKNFRKRERTSLRLEQNAGSLRHRFVHEYSIYHGITNSLQTTMNQWLTYRSTYLNIILEMEGRSSSPKCSVCSIGHADIKCSDCFGANLFCKSCCLEVHKRSPFHQTLLWTGKHYAQMSLYSQHFLLCLSHNGEPCPKTVKVGSFKY
jgi:hypothetical protein